MLFLYVCINLLGGKFVAYTSILIWSLNDTVNTMTIFGLSFYLLPRLFNRYTLISSIIISFLITWIDFYHANMGAVISIPIFIAIVLLPSLTKTRIRTAIILLYSFTTPQIISLICYGIVFRFKINPESKLIALVPILIFLLSLGLTCLIKKILSSYSINRYLKDQYIQKLILFVIFFLLITVMGINVVAKSLNIQFDYLQPIVALIITVIFLMIIGIFIFIRGRIKDIEVANQLKKLSDRKLYIKELERNYHELRQLKHNYQTVLLSLSNDQTNQLSQDSIQKLLSADDETDSNNDLIKLYHLKNNALRNVLVTNLLTIRDQGVNLTFELDSELLLPNTSEFPKIIQLFFDSVQKFMSVDDSSVHFALISGNDYSEFIIRTVVPDDFSLNNFYQSSSIKYLRKITKSNPNYLFQTKLEHNELILVITYTKGAQ